MVNNSKRSWISRFRRDSQDWYDETVEDISQRGTILRMIIITILVYLFVAMLVGIYWSQEPDRFDVKVQTDLSIKATQQAPVRGTTTTYTLIHVAKTLLDKPGGYLTNDVAPPGVWLDNIPNWEYGVLIQVRDMSKAMRESISRSQTQSTEDVDLKLAEPRLNFESESWMLPSSENQYREGIDKLEAYALRLSDTGPKGSQFYTRADNLSFWLSSVEARMGSLSQRLSASVGQARLNTDLAGDNAAKQATQAPIEMQIKTPWMEIDDVFYEARGTTWALIHLLHAVEIDFAEVLEKKNARVSLQQIIRELEATQEAVYSPMILNGSGFGVLANHSLVMASYISRANAALINLRELLARG